MPPQVPDATQPTETRGRRRASSAEEDPLTSAAFALRTSGPVDGRSSLRPGGSRPGAGPASTHGGASPTSTTSYLYTGTSYGGPSSATQAMSTPPYGENYGYGSQGPAPQGDDPRRQNGSRNPARRVYPQDSYPTGNRQGTAGYPGAGASYSGNGYRSGGYQGIEYPGSGYPGNGYPGGGPRAPYDPREDHLRLNPRP